MTTIDLRASAAPAPNPHLGTLNADQEQAVGAILAWIEQPGEPYFVLRGSAGTGKTFCVKHVVSRFKGRIVFTAPTNKATKVLRQSLTTDDYSPQCKTIYSLLGLRLEANGEVKELRGPDKDDEVDLSTFRCVVVDEGSMLNQYVLQFIAKAAKMLRVKFLFMGDAAQLPPVGESTSPIWKLECPSAELTKVMRHDNQILELVTRIRAKVDHPAPTVKLENNNNQAEGVWKLDRAAFNCAITEQATLFAEPDNAKIIAWRNITVDAFNRMVRQCLFDDAAKAKWLATDRVLFTEPAKDLDDEPMASTDDEGTITRVLTDSHPFYSEFAVHRLSITLDSGKLATALVLHPQSQAAYTARLVQLSAEAKAASRKWKAFWEFREAFHQVRHGYAITAHRSQGSTYKSVFVDVRDVLLNQNRQEAYRCLYVACSRPKKRLILT
jgi:exodeoxyribonuclease-5